jgi:hypothetical protein
MNNPYKKQDWETISCNQPETFYFIKEWVKRPILESIQDLVFRTAFESAWYSIWNSSKYSVYYSILRRK